MNAPSYSSEEAHKTERLKSINRDLRAALKALLVHAPESQPRYPTQYQADAQQARDAIARATTEKDEETQ